MHRLPCFIAFVGAAASRALFQTVAVRPLPGSASLPRSSFEPPFASGRSRRSTSRVVFAPHGARGAALPAALLAGVAAAACARRRPAPGSSRADRAPVARAEGPRMRIAGPHLFAASRADQHFARSADVVAMAKKKKGQKRPAIAEVRRDAEWQRRPPAEVPGSPASPGPDGEVDLDSRLDAVLRDAGITNKLDASSFPGDKSKDGILPTFGAAPNPEDPLSRIPKKGQDLLERFFGGGAIVFGTAFILCGLAVSFESVFKILGTPIPVWYEEIVVQLFLPAMTPSVLILFAFSISLGVLKQLQLGSLESGVLYTEDD